MDGTYGALCRWHKYSLMRLNLISFSLICASVFWPWVVLVDQDLNGCHCRSETYKQIIRMRTIDSQESFRKSGWDSDGSGRASVGLTTEIGWKVSELGEDFSARTPNSVKCSGDSEIDTRVNGCPILLDFRKRVVYSSYDRRLLYRPQIAEIHCLNAPIARCYRFTRVVLKVRPSFFKRFLLGVTWSKTPKV